MTGRGAVEPIQRGVIALRRRGKSRKIWLRRNIVNPSASKHPEDVCPRGVVLWIQLCRVRWDKEPSPVPFCTMKRISTFSCEQWQIKKGLHRKHPMGCRFMDSFVLGQVWGGIPSSKQSFGSADYMSMRTYLFDS